MTIHTVRVGEMGANCYLLTDETGSDTLIIDPGEEGDYLSEIIVTQKLHPIGIILTHGHYDHCLATLELKLNFNPPLYLHHDDLFLYQKAHLSANHFSRLHSPQLPPIDIFLSDKQEILLGQHSLKVIHTPGHTPGSICLYSPPYLFTGDTLFSDSVGRSDFSYSSAPHLQKSLQKIHELPPQTHIYPGHGDSNQLEFTPPLDNIGQIS